jgi:replicative DNA helicase
MLQDIALDVISTAYAKEETSIIGLPTGVADGAFDELTCGIEPGSFWIVAGLAGIGKSTLINAIVRGVRQNSPGAGVPLICSTEMMPRAVAMFALAGATGIHTKALARGGLSPCQKEKLLQVGRENTLEGIAVLYCGGMTVDKTLMLARRHHEAVTCPLVVIDVAGQLKGDGEKEYDRVSDISIKIKHFAKSQNICTIACEHLNREVKNEKDYEPKLWNLRGSGEWEQNADRVLFIHRKSMFFGSQNQEASPVTHIIQAKDRMYGDHRAIDIVWSKELGRYTTAQPDELTAG